jgi:hypothetical protein
LESTIFSGYDGDLKVLFSSEILRPKLIFLWQRVDPVKCKLTKHFFFSISAKIVDAEFAISDFLAFRRTSSSVKSQFAILFNYLTLDLVCVKER